MNSHLTIYDASTAIALLSIENVNTTEEIGAIYLSPIAKDFARYEDCADILLAGSFRRMGGLLDIEVDPKAQVLVGHGSFADLEYLLKQQFKKPWRITMDEKPKAAIPVAIPPYLIL
jgi:hypothetical protein